MQILKPRIVNIEPKTLFVVVARGLQCEIHPLPGKGEFLRVKVFTTLDGMEPVLRNVNGIFHEKKEIQLLYNGVRHPGEKCCEGVKIIYSPGKSLLLWYEK